MVTFIEKIEEIKQTPAYAVMVYYGEDIGLDDISTPIMERNCRVYFSPAGGYLGQVRCLVKMEVANLLKFDVKSVILKKVNNPPSIQEIVKNGFYAWGTMPTIDEFLVNCEERLKIVGDKLNK